MKGDGTMIKDLDDVLKERTLTAMKKFDGKIREQIVAEAKKQGYSIGTKDIESVVFRDFGDLTQSIEQKFGKFATTSKIDQPLAVNIAVANNNSAGQMSVTFTYDDTEKRTFSWSITDGVTCSASIKESVSIPGASSELTLGIQISKSVTQGVACEDTKHWGDGIGQTIPPYHAIRFQAILVRVVGDLPFELTIRKNGKAHCETTVKYHGSHTRKFDIALDRLLSDSDRTFTVKGKVSGTCGTEVHPDAKDVPLTDDQKKTLPPGLTSIPGQLGTLNI
jgi:Clostridium epsilon toxin ETX/Bacillus mosquitocidal toxin MTX2